jgi:hypothetical protein
MVRLVAARAIALAGVFMLFVMDHELFIPFGLFLAFGLFIVSAYLYRDFTDPKSLDDNQAYWAIMAGMILGGFSTEIIRSINIEIPTSKK